MKNAEELERTRSSALAVVFVCSVLLCASFLFLINYSWWHMHQSFPRQNALFIGDLALIVVMSFAAFWRWWAFKKYVKTYPSFRSVSKDERVKLAWLKAYRLAFFVLLIIQIASKVLLMVWFWGIPWEVPYQSALTLSAAVAVSVGAFLCYSRETRHE
jgi:hypothetical protein